MSTAHSQYLAGDNRLARVCAAISWLRDALSG
jgi:hypothetical protein